MAHTKEPWEYNALDGVVYISNHAHVVFEVKSPSTDTGICICIIPQEDVTPSAVKMVKANAALIAAAPDLLEAAKKALAEMSLTSAPRNSFTAAVDALDEAITKATQEAPNATRS